MIGSGLAGLAFALKAAELGEVWVVTKDRATETNTAMAQGGIAAVLSESDSFEQHIQDTLTAGAGLCREEVVRAVVEKAPDRIKDLIDWGIAFDLKDPNGSLIDPKNAALTREGGHSQRRIVHVQDHTGHSVHQVLLKKVRENPRIKILENHFAFELLTSRQLYPHTTGANKVFGAQCFNSETKEVFPIFSRATMLATGGSGKVFLYTTNWSGATGDGIAMAARIGARVANLEFTQFHPTCLYHPQARNFLISEALRGEGAQLINKKGEAFMAKSHPMGSLAPRDIVARAIDEECKRSGEPCVFLDVRHLSREFLEQRFPLIYEKCLQFGIDISKDPIPVVPASHYQCGGIVAALNGQTDVENLYAIGECAFTGLHGANRLASNSLLECLVTAHEAYESLKALNVPRPVSFEVLPLQIRVSESANDDELILISHLWDEIRTLMWNYVGIVRSNKRLERAKIRLRHLLDEIEDHYKSFKLSTDLIELRNLALVAQLTVKCALKRKESRGIHFNIDYPFTLPKDQARESLVLANRHLNPLFVVPQMASRD